jgi:8-oxo-dGTP diphosphatase
MNTKPHSLSVKAVIFNNAGQCLLIRRSAHNQNFVGKWEWPGGKVDPGEDFATALHREVAEETGLVIELGGLACATSFEMPKANVVLLCMEARLISGDVKLSEEHDDFVWVPMADSLQYEYPAHLAEMMVEYCSRHTTK